jgi:hypothetical protein
MAPRLPQTPQIKSRLEIGEAQFIRPLIDNSGRERDVNRNEIKAPPNTQNWARTISTCHTNSFIAGSCGISFLSPLIWIVVLKFV